MNHHGGAPPWTHPPAGGYQQPHYAPPQYREERPYHPPQQQYGEDILDYFTPRKRGRRLTPPRENYPDMGHRRSRSPVQRSWKSPPRNSRRRSPVQQSRESPTRDGRRRSPVQQSRESPTRDGRRSNPVHRGRESPPRDGYHRSPVERGRESPSRNHRRRSDAHRESVSFPSKHYSSVKEGVVISEASKSRSRETRNEPSWKQSEERARKQYSERDDRRSERRCSDEDRFIEKENDTKYIDHRHRYIDHESCGQRGDVTSDNVHASDDDVHSPVKPSKSRSKEMDRHGDREETKRKRDRKGDKDRDNDNGPGRHHSPKKKKRDRRRKRDSLTPEDDSSVSDYGTSDIDAEIKADNNNNSEIEMFESLERVVRAPSAKSADDRIPLIITVAPQTMTVKHTDGTNKIDSDTCKTVAKPKYTPKNRLVNEVQDKTTGEKHVKGNLSEKCHQDGEVTETSRTDMNNVKKTGKDIECTTDSTNKIDSDKSKTVAKPKYIPKNRLVNEVQDKSTGEKHVKGNLSEKCHQDSEVTETSRTDMNNVKKTGKDIECTTDSTNKIDSDKSKTVAKPKYIPKNRLVNEVQDKSTGEKHVKGNLSEKCHQDSEVTETSRTDMNNVKKTVKDIECTSSYSKLGNSLQNLQKHEPEKTEKLNETLKKIGGQYAFTANLSKVVQSLLKSGNKQSTSVDKQSIPVQAPVVAAPTIDSRPSEPKSLDERASSDVDKYKGDHVKQSEINNSINKLDMNTTKTVNSGNGDRSSEQAASKTPNNKYTLKTTETLTNPEVKHRRKSGQLNKENKSGQLNKENNDNTLKHVRKDIVKPSTNKVSSVTKDAGIYKQTMESNSAKKVQGQRTQASGTANIIEGKKHRPAMNDYTKLGKQNPMNKESIQKVAKRLKDNGNVGKDNENMGESGREAVEVNEEKGSVLFNKNKPRVSHFDKITGEKHTSQKIDNGSTRKRNSSDVQSESYKDVSNTKHQTQHSHDSSTKNTKDESHSRTEHSTELALVKNTKETKSKETTHSVTKNDKETVVVSSKEAGERKKRRASGESKKEKSDPTGGSKTRTEYSKELSKKSSNKDTLAKYTVGAARDEAEHKKRHTSCDSRMNTNESTPEHKMLLKSQSSGSVNKDCIDIVKSKSDAKETEHTSKDECKSGASKKIRHQSDSFIYATNVVKVPLTTIAENNAAVVESSKSVNSNSKQANTDEKQMETDNKQTEAVAVADGQIDNNQTETVKNDNEQIKTVDVDKNVNDNENSSRILTPLPAFRRSLFKPARNENTTNRNMPVETGASEHEPSATNNVNNDMQIYDFDDDDDIEIITIGPKKTSESDKENENVDKEGVGACGQTRHDESTREPERAVHVEPTGSLGERNEQSNEPAKSITESGPCAAAVYCDDLLDLGSIATPRRKRRYGDRLVDLSNHFTSDEGESKTPEKRRKQLDNTSESEDKTSTPPNNKNDAKRHWLEAAKNFKLSFSNKKKSKHTPDKLVGISDELPSECSVISNTESRNVNTPKDIDDDIQLLPSSTEFEKIDKEVYKKGFEVQHKKVLMYGKVIETKARLTPKLLYKNSSVVGSKKLGKCLFCMACTSYFSPLDFTMHVHDQSSVELLVASKCFLEEYRIDVGSTAHERNVFSHFEKYFHDQRNSKKATCPPQLPHSTEAILDTSNNTSSQVKSETKAKSVKSSRKTLQRILPKPTDSCTSSASNVAAVPLYSVLTLPLKDCNIAPTINVSHLSSNTTNANHMNRWTHNHAVIPSDRLSNNTVASKSNNNGSTAVGDHGKHANSYPRVGGVGQKCQPIVPAITSTKPLLSHAQPVQTTASSYLLMPKLPTPSLPSPDSVDYCQRGVEPACKGSKTTMPTADKGIDTGWGESVKATGQMRDSDLTMPSPEPQQEQTVSRPVIRGVTPPKCFVKLSDIMQQTGYSKARDINLNTVLEHLEQPANESMSTEATADETPSNLKRMIATNTTEVTQTKASEVRPTTDVAPSNTTSSTEVVPPNIEETALKEEVKTTDMVPSSGNITAPAPSTSTCGESPAGNDLHPLDRPDIRGAMDHLCQLLDIRSLDSDANYGFAIATLQLDYIRKIDADRLEKKRQKRKSKIHS